VVDVEGYRERRKASLTQLALRLGEKVKRSGKPATISPMNAYDRRIIHIALKSETRLRTQSSGTGSLRKLVIYPQKKQHASAKLQK
jgi:spoIIIJ-associated protein